MWKSWVDGRRSGMKATGYMVTQDKPTSTHLFDTFRMRTDGTITFTYHFIDQNIKHLHIYDEQISTSSLTKI